MEHRAGEKGFAPAEKSGFRGGLEDYGSYMPLPNAGPARKRLNWFAFAQAVLMPWAVFSASLVLLSSSVHYNHSWLSDFLLACGALLVIVLAFRSTSAHHAQGEKTWHWFLTVTCGIAIVLAVLLGSWNYITNCKPWYHLNDLNMVHDVDPASAGGKAYLDASAVVFKEGTHIDMSRALSFKDGDLYCVAPITIGDAPLAQYDFWAVGVNCCRPFGGDFWCGGKTYDPTATAGLRVTQDYSRERYRLGVQQAASEYGIKASSPMFLSWTAETALEDEIAAYMDRSRRFVRWSIILHLLFQTISVGIVLSVHNSANIVGVTKKLAADTKHLMTMDWQQ